MKKQFRDCRILFFKFIVAFIAILGFNHAQSQSIDVSQPCNGVNNALFPFPGITAGVIAAIAPINASNIPGGTTVTMQIRGIDFTDPLGATTSICPPALPPCTSPQIVAGLTITAAGPNLTITGTPDANKAGSTIAFTIRALVSDGTFCDRSYVLPIVRKPIDIGFVLDKSGSMGWSFDGTNTSPPAGTRRWDGLVTGVGVAVTKLNALGPITNDKIALRYFSDAVVLPGGIYAGGLQIMNAGNLTALNTEVSSNGPGGNTALGDGIVAVKGLLLPGTAGNNKHMIVFTDGMQNAGDQVKAAAGAGQYTQTVGGIDLNGTNEIKIHTICLSNGGGNPTLMEGIATNNGGQYFNSLAGDQSDFLTNSFLGQLVTILSNGTPRFVDLRNGLYSSSANGLIGVEKFKVNKGVDNVIVTLVSSIRPFFRSVTKDGTDLTQFVIQQGGNGFQTFHIKFPIPSLPNVTPDGEWTVTIGGGGGDIAHVAASRYSISMIVDDHLNHLKFGLGGQDFKVGQTLNPTVTIGRGIVPSTGATVQAIVLKPGDDVNDLLARTNVKIDSSSVDPASPDVLKLAKLMQDSAFIAKIRAQNRLVNLTFQASSKTYTGSFSGLDVVGIYRVIYRISETTPEFGTVNGFAQQSFNVAFKDVSLNSSNLVLSTNAAGHSVITFRPISSTGKFIGPGWASAISISSPSVQTQKIEDLGDGTYRIEMNGKLSGKGQINIGNQKVFDGKLNNLDCYAKNKGFFKAIICFFKRLFGSL